MAERYQRLYALSADLYTPGAPVMIAAGALLLDTVTNGVLAQLKLKNIGARLIKSVKVALAPQDPAGRPLGKAVSYQYLDLDAARDAEFGQKNPIAFPDGAARAFTAAVTEVIFEDSTVWTPDADAAWEPIPAPESLEIAIDDPELLEQYRLHFGTKAAVRPTRLGDLWRCACGALNHAEEETCHACSLEREALLDCDFAALEQEKEARLADEAAEREARKAAAEAAAKKTKKILKIAIPALIVVIIAAVIASKVSKVKGVESLAEQALADGGPARAAMIYYENQDVKGDFRARSFALWAEAAQRETLSTYNEHTVALREDGTVVATGNNEEGQCDVSDWTEIVAVSAGAFHTVGLRADGTVVATGYNDYGQCDVSGWTDIVSISAGVYYTVGLRADGTALMVGYDEEGQYDVSDWTDIIAISAGNDHIVGLRADGTVVAVGENEDRQCNVSSWSDIVAVSAGRYHTIGLCADGTVVATGGNKYKQCDVQFWDDIAAVSTSLVHTVGLRTDGTVVATGYEEYGQCDVAKWKDIVAVSAGAYHTVGLRADGSVVAVGENEDGQCDVFGWKDIRLPNAAS